MSKLRDSQDRSAAHGDACSDEISVHLIPPSFAEGSAPVDVLARLGQHLQCTCRVGVRSAQRTGCLTRERSEGIRCALSEMRGQVFYLIFRDFAGPVATVIAASAAAYFARQQWKTAQEKVRLDLFDRRFTIYRELRAGVSRARGGDQGAVLGFHSATSQAQFLFGPEVTSFLEGTARDLAADLVQWQSPRPASAEQQEAASNKLVARANRLDAFFNELDMLVGPYMKHHQKNP